MILYETVGFREAWPQIKDLVALQWEEVDHRRKTSMLDVMETTYEAMEDKGIHYVVLATQEDIIVGYVSMFIVDSPHTGTLHATVDTIYTNSEMRDLGIGTGLIEEAEVEAKALGAQHIMVAFKNNQNHPNIVEELGFFSYETIYSKAIG